MRHFVSLKFLTAAAVVFISGNAFAQTTEHSFTQIINSSPDGNVVGNTINGLSIGDEFEVGIELNNASGAGILTVFTHLKYDNTVIEIVNGFADNSAFPPEPGSFPNPGNSLFSIGAPAMVLGQPGTAFGITLAVSNPLTGDGRYSEPNSGVVAIAIFRVVGMGETTIEHVDAGPFESCLGTSEAPTFSDPLMVVVMDTDGDGIPDALDNCLETPNPDQLDGNLDGYGNACDCDFNNDGIVNGLDFGPLIGAFNTANDTIDPNGDGVVNGLDFSPFISKFNMPVGPSGLACAGTINCQ